MAQHAVCFIDDDPREIQRFRNALGNQLIIGAGQSRQAALEDLQRRGRRKPDIFLVDLYHPQDRVPSDQERAELHKARAELARAQSAFRSLLAQIGQTSASGFNIARELRRDFKIGVAFFTRKGTFEDAIQAYEEEHAASVIKKPDPPALDQIGVLESAYDASMQDNAALLLGQIQRAIRRSSWWGAHRRDAVAFAVGVATSFIASALWSVVHG